MQQIAEVVGNLLSVLGSQFEIFEASKNAPIYNLHFENGSLSTLIIVANLNDDFRFPVSMFRIIGNSAKCGEVYLSGIDQVLIVSVISETEYVVHAIVITRLLNLLADWIAKYPICETPENNSVSWNLLIPIFELEAISYKSFTQKIKQ